MRGAIEEANIFHAVGRSADGFDGIGAEIGLCGDVIARSGGFAGTLDAAIESLGGAWDPESAAHYIEDLLKIVALGKLIRRTAREIERLLRANIALMEAADPIYDVGDGLKELGGKLAFWKKK